MKTMRSLLCLVLALLMVVAAVPALAAPIPMTVFSVDAVDAKTGEGAYYDDDLWGLTGHQIKLSIANAEPAGANTSVKWKSSNPSVASINSKGLITCKKAGIAQITVTAKYGTQQASIPLYVKENGASYGAFPSELKSELLAARSWQVLPSRIYQKGGNVFADMSVFNGSSLTLKGSVKIYAGYTLDATNDTIYDFISLGKVALKFKGSIKPGMEGKATIALGKKINPAYADLTDSFVLCNPTPFGKGVKGIGDFESFASGALARMKRTGK